jgi:predicted HTH domain antitoxin
MAHTLRFEWDVPETVFDEQFPAETFLMAVKVDAVCKLITAGRLSSGYAAGLLGITRRALFDLLRERNLPLVDYTADALAQDLQTLQTLAAPPDDAPQAPHAS